MSTRSAETAAPLSRGVAHEQRAEATGARYWLIVGPRRGRRAEALTLVLADGTRVLPVFSFEEEAAAFLSARGTRRGAWAVEGVGAAELLSTLFGSSPTDAQKVALDPMPGVADEVSACLVGVSRDRFAAHLRNREASRLHRGTGPATLPTTTDGPRCRPAGGGEA